MIAFFTVIALFMVRALDFSTCIEYDCIVIVLLLLLRDVASGRLLHVSIQYYYHAQFFFLLKKMYCCPTIRTVTMQHILIQSSLHFSMTCYAIESVYPRSLNDEFLIVFHIRHHLTTSVVLLYKLHN